VANRQAQVAGAENVVGGNTLNKTFNLIVTLDPANGNGIVGCAGLYTDFWSSTGDTGMDIIYTGGNVGIGSPNTGFPASKLDNDGTVQANAFMYKSDARLKDNVREIPSALERVLRLRGVNYDWKDGKKNQLGLIAQEVEEVFPEAVTTNQQSGLKSVGYGNLIAPVVEAFKEQGEILSRQAKEIEELKKAVQRRK
jgi:hypothetical protein